MEWSPNGENINWYGRTAVSRLCDGGNLKRWVQDFRTALSPLSISSESRILLKSSQASTIMRKFHNVVMQAMAGNSNDRLMRAYTWNDSVLLLAYVDKNRHDYESVLRQVDCLKQKIDSVRKSYAVVVKGQAFPPPEGQNTSPNGTVRLHRSIKLRYGELYGNSGNVFSRENRHQWYLDQRIESEISELLAQRASAKKVSVSSG